MLRATNHAHRILQAVLKPGDFAVDATVGNGYDTLWLAEQVGQSGHVIGFDIQAHALTKAAQRLAHLTNVTLHHRGHEHLAEMLPSQAQRQLSAIVFNLGYLPGAEKTIVTRAETTCAAVQQGLAHLKQNGVMTLVLYPGHAGGDVEATAVRNVILALPETFAITQCTRLNTLHPSPELLVIERLR